MLEFTFTASAPEDPAQTGTLQLRGTATIEFCNDLRGELLEAMRKTSSLVIDLSELTAIDVTGLQLLCAAHKSTLRDPSRRVCLGAVSEAFELQLREAGFHCALPTTCLESEGDSCLWHQSGPAGKGEKR